MVRSIDHIELVVRNVDEFVQMFEALGFKLIRRTQHHKGSAELRLPGPNQPVFEIHNVAGQENPEMNHIAFLTDDIEKDYKELVAKGVEFHSSPPYPITPHFVPSSGRKLASFRSPDGCRLQLVDVKKKKEEAIKPEAR